MRLRSTVSQVDASGSVVLDRDPDPTSRDSAMWPAFEQALARYHELEQQLADPAVIADRARYTQRRQGAWLLAKIVKPYLEFKKLDRGDRPGRGRCWPPRADAGDAAATARGGAGRLRAAPTGAADAARRPAADRAGRGFRQRHHGNPRRHRRRRGGPVRRRPLRHVHALRPRPRLEGRGHLLQPRRAGRLQGNHLQRHRRRRLSSTCATRAAAIASSACPRPRQQGRIHTSAATVAVLPEPDEVQVEIKRPGHRMGTHARRRRGRPARQQDRKRRPHLVQEGHARRDGSQVPGRAQPAQELRPGHAHPAQPALRTPAAEAAPASAPSSAAP